MFQGRRATAANNTSGTTVQIMIISIMADWPGVSGLESEDFNEFFIKGKGLNVKVGKKFPLFCFSGNCGKESCFRDGC